MSKSISIKLWDGWRIIHNGEITVCNSPKEVWDWFGWDIENDKNASECATEITKQMYCFGYIDLTPLCTKRGDHLFLEVIPSSDCEVAE